MVKDYFVELENQLILYREIIKTHSITKKYYNQTKGYIYGEIIFIDDTKLVFIEVVDTEEENKIKYSYHYMNRPGNMIFRYDNAYHHKNIKTFPHHKHIENEVKSSPEPFFNDVLTEISGLI